MAAILPFPYENVIRRFGSFSLPLFKIFASKNFFDSSKSCHGLNSTLLPRNYSNTFPKIFVSRNSTVMLWRISQTLPEFVLPAIQQFCHEFLEDISKTCLSSISTISLGTPSETVRKLLLAAIQQKCFHDLLTHFRNLFYPHSDNFALKVI